MDNYDMYWADIYIYLLIGPRRENLTLLSANNKGADQSAHSRSLISTFCYSLFGEYGGLLYDKFQYSSKSL